MRRHALALLVVFAGACFEENDMALPGSRDFTYTPGSQVRSADLNDLQDQIIALATGIRMIPSTIGRDSSSVGANGWDAAASTVVSVNAGTTPYHLPIVVNSGEVGTLVVNLSQSVAAAGGTLTLVRTDASGVDTTVASQNIANATGRQSVTVVTGHAVVSGQSYALMFSFASGTGTKTISNCTWTWHR